MLENNRRDRNPNCWLFIFVLEEKVSRENCHEAKHHANIEQHSKALE